MNCKQILIFDISSEYGHFRKFNTTTSPLTYSIPTRPAVAGLIGAILGIERETAPGRYEPGVTPVLDLLSYQKAHIGIQLCQPVKKVNIGFNLLSTKSFSDFYNINDRDGKGKIKDTHRRTQIEFELLKKPHFRIFLAWPESPLFDELKERIISGKLHFTPYLGLSQFTAKVDFIDACSATLLQSDDFVPVVTAVNLAHADKNQPVQFSYENARYTSDTMPVDMLPSRIVLSYSEVLIETNGQPIRVKSQAVWATERHGNILFL